MTEFKQFSLADYAHCLIVTDDNVAELYNIRGDNVFLLPQGEQAKRFAEAEKLCAWFLRKNLCRGGKVIAVGGGSVGDVVGFACSIYKRGGVKLTHVPTTLIAQIDSSIGGKTALNVEDVKNAVGSFYPADTAIDLNFLKTLDEVQLKSGLGELLKYRMLSHDIDDAYCGEITERVVKACVDYKQQICQADPFDGGIRKTLNFGHTIGHAMELYYGLLHGYAVANGIYYETTLAFKSGKCDKDYFDKWTDLIKNQYEIYPLNSDVLNAALNDKKNDFDGICFTLPTNFDETYLSLNELLKRLC